MSVAVTPTSGVKSQLETFAGHKSNGQEQDGNKMYFIATKRSELETGKKVESYLLLPGCGSLYTRSRKQGGLGHVEDQ